MKQVIFIIGVMLHFSFTCFSQDSKTHHQNIRLIHIVHPISILKHHHHTVKTLLPSDTLFVDTKIKKENLIDGKTHHHNIGLNHIVHPVSILKHHHPVKKLPALDSLFVDSKIKKENLVDTTGVEIPLVDNDIKEFRENKK